MNFISTFDELNKLYEEIESNVSEAFDNDNGATNWNKAVIGYYNQAAKELGLTNFDMKLTGYGNNAKVIITAEKAGKKLEAQESDEQATHNIKNVSDAKEFIKYVFAADLAESFEDTDDEIEIVDDEMSTNEISAKEPIVSDEPRQLIIECNKCGALVIKDEAEVIAAEDSDTVNVEDKCEFCEESEGYKIVGVVIPYEANEDSESETEEIPVDESVATESSDEEDLKELLNVNVDASGFGGAGNDVSVLSGLPKA